MKIYTFSKKSNNNLSFPVHSDLKIVMKCALEDSPIDFGIIAGLRTDEKQFELYSRGRAWNDRGQKWEVINKKEIVSNCDGITSKSKHQIQDDSFCHAVDIVAYVPELGGYTNDRETLAYLGGHIMSKASELFKRKIIENKIIWGGNWDSDDVIIKDQKLIDLPHFQTDKYGI